MTQATRKMPKQSLFSHVSWGYIFALGILLPILTSVSLDVQAQKNCPVFFVRHKGNKTELFKVNLSKKCALNKVKTINKAYLHLAVDEKSSTLFFVGEKNGEFYKLKGKKFVRIAKNLPKGIVGLAHDAIRDVLYAVSSKTKEVYVIYENGYFQSLGKIKNPNGKKYLDIKEDSGLAVDNKGDIYILATESGRKMEIYKLLLHNKLSSKYFKKGLNFHAHVFDIARKW